MKTLVWGIWCRENPGNVRMHCYHRNAISINIITILMIALLFLFIAIITTICLLSLLVL